MDLAHFLEKTEIAPSLTNLPRIRHIRLVEVFAKCISSTSASSIFRLNFLFRFLLVG